MIMENDMGEVDQRNKDILYSLSNGRASFVDLSSLVGLTSDLIVGFINVIEFE